MQTPHNRDSSSHTAWKLTAPVLCGRQCSHTINLEGKTVSFSCVSTTLYHKCVLSSLKHPGPVYLSCVRGRGEGSCMPMIQYMQACVYTSLGGGGVAHLCKAVDRWCLGGSRSPLGKMYKVSRFGMFPDRIGQRHLLSPAEKETTESQWKRSLPLR